MCTTPRCCPFLPRGPISTDRPMLSSATGDQMWSQSRSCYTNAGSKGIYPQNPSMFNRKQKNFVSCSRCVPEQILWIHRLFLHYWSISSLHLTRSDFRLRTAQPDSWSTGMNRTISLSLDFLLFDNFQRIWENVKFMDAYTRIGSTGRLGQAESSNQFTGSKPGQILSFLFWVAIQEDTLETDGLQTEIKTCKPCWCCFVEFYHLVLDAFST